MLPLTGELLRPPLRPREVLLAVTALFRRLLHRQAHHAGRYHGGYGVLVHHLTNAVLQQHDKLIKGLDLEYYESETRYGETLIRIPIN